MPTTQPLPASRTVTTPAATMHTLASPTTEPPTDVAVWRTELPAGTAGPLHAVDRDHVVVVVEGSLGVVLGGERTVVPTGGSVVLGAGVSRQLAAADGPAVTITAASPGSTASVGGGDPVAVPWAR